MKRAIFVFLGCWLLVCTVYASDMAWEEIARGETDVRSVLVSPDNPRVIFMGTNRAVFRTVDAGESWKSVLLLKGQNKKVNMLLFASGKPGRIFAATGSGLFESSNNGGSWRRIFQGKDYFESDCTAVAVSPGVIYLGTGRGLFISNDNGRSWTKAQGRLSDSRIFSITYNGTAKGCVYVACAAGVYKRQNGADGWERVFTSRLSENGDDSEDASDEAQQDDYVSDINYISCSPSGDKVYLATSRGVYLNRDGGREWVRLSEYGLLDRNVIFLLSNGESGIYGLTFRGAFEYSDQRWQELSFGITAEEFRYMACDSKGILYIASNRGLFKGSLVADRRGGYQGQLDFYSQGEPGIAEVQKAAIQYAEVSPEKIKRWRKQAAAKAILPKFSAGVGRDTADLWHWESGSSAKECDDVLRRGRDTLDWDVSLSWDLSEIIWNPDQTSIDVRSKLMVQLRDDILDEVTKLYFERLRVKVEIDELPIEAAKKRVEKQLRMRELTASIDALTGGYFSSQIAKNNA